MKSFDFGGSSAWLAMVILLTCQILTDSAAVLKSSPRKKRASTTTATTTTAASTSTSSRVDVFDDKSEDDDDARLSRLWLDDFDTEFAESDDDDDDDEMLSDSPQLLGDDGAGLSNAVGDGETPSCPPPPNHLSPFSCRVPRCDSDKQCQNGTLCCFNGCNYTCMTPVAPPPYIDWKRQPQRRLVAGSSWLIPGPKEGEEVEWCSTTEVFEEDEDPLLCPQGYICLIEDPGDPGTGIPNRGRCVQHATSKVNANRDSESAQGVGKVDCQIGTRRHANGSSFKFESHTCRCRLGTVLCFVGKPANRRAPAARQSSSSSSSDGRRHHHHHHP